MKTITLPVLKCKRCGYEWTARSPDLPPRCAKCGSPYWNRARRKRERT